MNVIGQADIQHLITDELPSLGDAICDLHGQRIRRIDRYIELCLLGALQCTRSHKPPTNTGLVLASQNSALSSVVKVMESILDEHYAPKPFDFINTLGNSACFYVAQLLGLSGKSIGVSRESFSFEAGLYHALLDLESDTLQTVLVGCVDEALLPLSTHRSRIAYDKHRAVEGPIGENSSWILLRKEAIGLGQFRLDCVLDFSSQSDLIAWITAGPDSGEALLQTCYSLDDEERLALTTVVGRLEEYQAAFSVSGSETNSAASIMTMLANNETQYRTMLHLNKNKDGDYVLVRFVSC
jgi:hypothetical protein